MKPHHLNIIGLKLCGCPAWKYTYTKGYTRSVGVQHGNHINTLISPTWCNKVNLTLTNKHKMIYKLCGSPTWKHAFIQEEIQAIRGSPTWKHTSVARGQRSSLQMSPGARSGGANIGLNFKISGLCTLRF